MSGREELPRTFGEAVRVFFRHGSPRILTAGLALALAARALLGPVGWLDLVPFAVLVALWPIQEWLIHVFVLHYQPKRIAGRTIDFEVPRKHRQHHADPWRLDLLFVPIHVFAYLPLYALFFWAVTPSAAIACSAFAAYLLLSLHYEWVHYLAHVHYTPRLGYYRERVKSHRRHHFKNEHYWYGVSMISGDRLLRTRPEIDAVETSPTARRLLEHDAPAPAA